jgi:hypothetical protein
MGIRYYLSQHQGDRHQPPLLIFQLLQKKGCFIEYFPDQAQGMTIVALSGNQDTLNKAKEDPETLSRYHPLARGQETTLMI